MCYHWVVTKRNSRIYSISTVAPKFARFESSWLQCVASTGREGVYTVQNTYHRSERTEIAKEWSVPSWIMSSLQQPFVSGVVDSSRSVMRVLYTLLQCFPQVVKTLDSKLEKLEDSVRWDNSGVSFCNKSTVACAQRAFQVSQRSVETLFM